MMKNRVLTIGVCSFLLFMAGCDAGLIVGSKAMGVSSGEFIYKEGYVVATYNDSLEKLWKAVEDVFREMKASDIKKDKKIAQGTMNGWVSGEKITVKVDYQERDKTFVAVLAGMGGSKIAARLIHDKIAQRLSRP